MRVQAEKILMIHPGTPWVKTLVGLYMPPFLEENQDNQVWQGKNLVWSGSLTRQEPRVVRKSDKARTSCGQQGKNLVWSARQEPRVVSKARTSCGQARSVHNVTFAPS